MSQPTCLCVRVVALAAAHEPVVAEDPSAFITVQLAL